ncbi:asparagine synthase (glutamine-hydrolyzing) [Streptomyces sp. TRM S81-3]|uniref:asparagine synthase (glutamine-hydrolyzing) n=1 Tax=Streptomyces griseicoloratus TaxID=2752516 RepID=A0A926L3D5_9ACTN|nr:asparagine synthase (glutamine-hydrolyzing) [Streptomyces griseicoloratus]MBD0421723.1 asparagine synthase (glutamine-hydrolyzing) [Streptomyces griseicoloratus]
MCGISGWVSYQRDLRSERPTAEAMNATMACRGPDAQGLWLDTHAALGHRRLAIIDLPGGVQPMSEQTPDGDVVLVYSGEAYNYTELRDELRHRGHCFHTDSDTEVVLRGYLEWDADLPEHLNGMFAFAVWDGRTDRLLLVRDRMGIKPLYYFTTDDGVLFGSEPKAILANPLAPRTVDLDGLRELFSMAKTPGHAIWAGMREVEPGTVVTVQRAGLNARPYWQLSAVEHTDSQQDTIARVRELLDDIVRRQLVSDVPRCVLLSGGLDSSAITALAAQQLRGKETVRSFAVDFVGQSENFIPDGLRSTPDTPYVHDVVRHAGTEHEDIVLDPAGLADPDVRAAAVRARDLPLGLGDMDQSLLLLFRAIRKHSTVALSGESADEVFGGYAWFHDPAARDAGTFPWLAALERHHGRGGSSLLDPELRERLDLPGYLAQRYEEAMAQVPHLDSEKDPLERRMREVCHLHLTRFVRMLLDRKDRLSMATGLEVRVPFCDHRLVEYVFNTPWSMKTFDGREKSLLRAATEELLPRSVVERAKSPYPSTQDPAYVAELQTQVRDLLSSDDNPALGLLNRARMQEITTTPPGDITTAERNGLERALDLAVWADLEHPTLTS